MSHRPTSDERTPWQATVVTLFPQMFPGPLGESLSGQALENRLWSLLTIAIRDFGVGAHHSVDDTPAGGGAGMVMRADVLGPAIDEAQTQNPGAPLIYLSPRGEPFRQSIARELSKGPGVTLIAGRFEGIDERLIEAKGLREISMGDYVLSGGELAAMALIDACVRLRPGVLGATQSLVDESFENGLLEYPQYTKPREWEGLSIPDVLVSGNHEKIADWRKKLALELTRHRRPDLISSPKPPQKT